MWSHTGAIVELAVQCSHTLFMIVHNNTIVSMIIRILHSLQYPQFHCNYVALELPHTS